MMPVIVSRETFVTALLVWTSLGAMILIVLDGLGIVRKTYLTRPNTTRTGMVLASLMVIVAWPMFGYVWLRKWRRAS